MGNRWCIADALRGLGQVATKLGDYDTAVMHFKESLAIIQEVYSQRGIADALCNLAFAFLKLGKVQEAQQYLMEALPLAWETEAMPITFEILANFALSYLLNAEFERCAEFTGLVANQPATPFYVRQLLDPILVELGRDLSPDVLKSALIRGMALELKTVVESLLLEAMN
jgi:tetratricopeptide (TPR) repeat protein